MESSEKAKLIKNLPKLLEETCCNVMMIAHLKARNIISMADEAHLKSFTNEMIRAKEMFELLMTCDGGYKHLVEALRFTRQTGALKLLGENSEDEVYNPATYFGSPDGPEHMQVREGIKRLLERDKGVSKKSRNSTQEKLIFYNIRPPSQLFTGRSKELDFLIGVMAKQGSTAVLTQNSSITGLGGIGKTELAKMFIHSIDFKVNDPLFNCVIWINGENDGTASEDLKKLATDKLGISTVNANGSEEEITTILDKIYADLKSRKSIIVFDNVENPDFMEKYRPNHQIDEILSISILITSQASNWNTSHEIRLSGLDELDAIELVKKGLSGLNFIENPKEGVNQQIQRLVSRLQYFPLAITQAIALIKNKAKITEDYGPDDFLRDLDEKPKQVLSHSLTGTGSLYKKTVYETTEFTLKKVEDDEESGQVSSRMVKMMSYMTAEHISEAIFKGICDNDLDTAFLLLEKYSVISFTPRRKGKPLSVNIHRLVQEVLRLISQSKNEEITVLDDCMTLITNNLDVSTVDQAISDIPGNITELLVAQERLNDAYAFALEALNTLQVNFSYNDHTCILVKMELQIGVILFNQSRFGESKDFLETAIKNASNFISKDDTNILNLRYRYAKATASLGEFQDALVHLIETYNGFKHKTSEEESWDSINVLVEIGYNQSRLKNHKEATLAYEKITKLLPKFDINADYHNVMTVAKTGLAEAKSDMGETEIGLAELIEAYNYGKLYLDSKNRTLIYTKINLAVYLHRAGKTEDAVQVNRELCEELSVVLGEEHINFLIVKYNLLDTSMELEGPSDNLLSSVIELYHEFKRICGEGSFYTVMSYAMVGQVLCQLNQGKEALHILTNALMSKPYVECADATIILQTKFYIALTYEKLDRYKEALECLSDINNAELTEPLLKEKVCRSLERVTSQLSNQK